MVLNLRPKCANPSCAARFEWLAGGRLIRVPHDPEQKASLGENSGALSHSHEIGHFWLCEKCSNIYTLQFKSGHGVVIRPLWPELPAAGNSMRLSTS